MTSTPTPLAPDDDRDLQQLTGVFDRPIAPSPAFAERLRQQAIAASNKERETIMEIVAPATVIPARQHRVIPMPMVRRSSGILESVAAAVLVIALLGSIFLVNRISNGPSTPGPDPNGQRLAAVTSPIASATPAPENIDLESTSRGGLLGTAGDLNRVYPDASLPNEPLAPSWKQVLSAPIWIMPYGDVVAALGTSDLTVYDASSGNVLWTQPVTDAFSDHLSDHPRNPSLAFATQGAGAAAVPWIDHGTMYITTASELVGLDLMTGEATFSTPHNLGATSVQGMHLMPSNLVIDAGVAYLLSRPDVSGKIWFTAIDLATGDIVWRTQKDSATPFGYMIVSTNQVIYAVNDNDDNRIVALNADDGSLAWQTPNIIHDPSLRSRDAVNLFAAGDVLIEIRASTSSTTGPESPSPEDALRIATYDLDTGDVLWTSRSDDASWGLDANTINGCGFYPRVARDSIIIPCSDVGSTTFKLISLPLRGNGEAESVPEHEHVPAATTSIISGETAWVYGAGDEIVRLDLVTGAITPLGTMGGETCTQQSMPTHDGFVCLTTNGVGTYYVQAFGPTGDTTVASPQASARPDIKPK